MKKLPFLILLFLLSAALHGQSNTRYGFKGGLNMGSADVKAYSGGTEIAYEAGSRASVYVGAFMEFSLEGISPSLYSHLELQYVSSGFKMDSSALSPEFVNKLEQLNVPFVFKYRVADQVFITAGIYWGLIVKVEEKNASGVINVTTENYKAYDAGLLIGAEIPLNNKFFLEARYNLGLVDVNDLDPQQGTGQGRYLNRFLQLGVGVKF